MMVTSLARSLTIAAFVVIFATPLHAQDVLSRARSAPTRADGIALLATHLAERPRDVDARVLYALMLSWDGSYDAARREFQRVLEQAPSSLDARVGLMNVEWWSGRLPAAREQVDSICSANRATRRRDSCASASTRRTGRGGRRRRSASSDSTTAAVPGTSSSSRCPDRRSADCSSAAPAGRTASPAPISSSRSTSIRACARAHTASYLLALRPTICCIRNAASPSISISALGTAWRCRVASAVSSSRTRPRSTSAPSPNIWATGCSPARSTVYGARHSRLHVGPRRGAPLLRRRWQQLHRIWLQPGLSREEIRGIGDLIALDSQTVRGQIDTLVTPRLRLQVEAGLSRQERSGRALWQTAVSSGFSVRF